MIPTTFVIVALALCATAGPVHVRTTPLDTPNNTLIRTNQAADHPLGRRVITDTSNINDLQHRSDEIFEMDEDLGLHTAGAVAQPRPYIPDRGQFEPESKSNARERVAQIQEYMDQLKTNQGLPIPPGLESLFLDYVQERYHLGTELQTRLEKYKHRLNEPGPYRVPASEINEFKMELLLHMVPGNEKIVEQGRSRNRA